MSRYDDMPPEKLEELRRMIEEMDTIEVIDDDTRKLIEKRWPWLLDKLTPKKPSECDTLTSATPAPAASRALTVHGLLHREGLNGGDDRRRTVSVQSAVSQSEPRIAPCLGDT